jgi:hypothetical protein
MPLRTNQKEMPIQILIQVPKHWPQYTWFTDRGRASVNIFLVAAHCFFSYRNLGNITTINEGIFCWKIHPFISTSGYPWRSDTIRPCPAPSLLELQGERRETTELGYLGRCRRQPPKTHGPCFGPLVAKSLVYGPGPGSSWEIGLRHRPGLILTPAISHTWAPPGPRQVFFTVRLFDRRHPSLGVGTWDLGPGLVGTRDSVSKEVKLCDWGPE